MAGTPLTAQAIQSSYAGLLKTTDNATLSAVLRTMTDGLGVDSALQVSTLGIKTTGTFDAAGLAAFAAAVTMASTLVVTGTITASNFSGTHSGASSGTNTGDQTNISGNAATATTAAACSGNAATVTTNANLTGDVTSVGNATTYNATLPVAKGGTGATTVANARTALGVALTRLGNTQTGVTGTAAGVGAAVVMPSLTVQLTAGKWMIVATICVRMTATSGEGKLEFSDAAGNNVFGGGVSGFVGNQRQHATVIGYKSVPSGTFDVYVKGTGEAACIIDLGSASATAYAGTLEAFLLEGA